MWEREMTVEEEQRGRKGRGERAGQTEEGEREGQGRLLPVDGGWGAEKRRQREEETRGDGRWRWEREEGQQRWERGERERAE